jgi:beta-galactosidase
MHRIDLSGTWSLPDGRPTVVPGLAAAPDRMAEGPLRLVRRLRLPAGAWTQATLLLPGARFRPRVLIDGRERAVAEGGMAPVSLPLGSLPAGVDLELAVELASLAQVPIEDASCIPAADHWRSNLSSCLWDVPELQLHGPARIDAVVADRDPQTGAVEVRWRWSGPAGTSVSVELRADDGATAMATAPAMDGRVRVPGGEGFAPWSPESPVLHRLRLVAHCDGSESDVWERPVGLRRLAVAGVHFRFNGRPWTMRAGSVVWHRLCRDPEARTLAFDADWFERAVVLPLKRLGANTLRWHLGMPPRRLIDLCDRHGMAVQAEWCAFHGLNGSPDSLRAQWGDWMWHWSQHPSCVLFHAWNETDDALLAKGFAALDAVAAELPPTVLAHRDTIHLHKYWWSLFENVGCYVDDLARFGKAAVSDEFGGNYLDGEAAPGMYPSVRPSLRRFLGDDHGPSERLELQARANARMAEYWRRLDTAGFSPFCILGSREDGNHHFSGTLLEARPKPVWSALSAAYAPVAASLDRWDQHEEPGAEADLPIWIGNDTAEPCRVEVAVELDGRTIDAFALEVPAHGRQRVQRSCRLPAGEGVSRIAVRTSHPTPPAGPPASTWEIARVRPWDGTGCQVEALDEDVAAFAAGHGARPGPGVIAGSAATWTALVAGDPAVTARIAAALDAGRHVVLLEAGPRFLGSSYDSEALYRQADGIPPQPARRESVPLPAGLIANFTWLPEPETFLHAGEDGSLLAGLPGGMPRLWNGMRGGVSVPAIDLELAGLGREAFLTQWSARGADPAMIRSGRCIAYELHGQFRFAVEHDPAVEAALREHIRFLHADAPALAHVLDPRARIRRSDVGAGFAAAGGRAERIVPRLRCGLDLTRVPVVTAHLAGGGRLTLCQLLTAGRLRPGPRSEAWAPRYDPAMTRLIGALLSES